MATEKPDPNAEASEQPDAIQEAKGEIQTMKPKKPGPLEVPMHITKHPKLPPA
jgi:hypothetical protein